MLLLLLLQGTKAAYPDPGRNGLLPSKGGCCCCQETLQQIRMQTAACLSPCSHRARSCPGCCWAGLCCSEGLHWMIGAAGDRRKMVESGHAPAPEALGRIPGQALAPEKLGRSPGQALRIPVEQEGGGLFQGHCRILLDPGGCHTHAWCRISLTQAVVHRHRRRRRHTFEHGKGGRVVGINRVRESRWGASVKAGCCCCCCCCCYCHDCMSGCCCFRDSTDGSRCPAHVVAISISISRPRSRSVTRYGMSLMRWLWWLKWWVCSGCG